MAQYPTDGDIDTTFPDNDTGEIGADDMRAFQKSMTAAGKDYAAMTENVPTTFPPATHNHPISDVTDLQTELDGKAPTIHTHTEAQITDLDKYTQAEVDAALGGKVDGAGLNIEVVATLPGTTDPNTIYFVTG